MANPLLLMALIGGGLYYMSQKDKKPVVTTTTKPDIKKDPEPNKPIQYPNGFLITNCKSIVVSDPEKFKAYNDTVITNLLKSTNYNITDTNAPFDFAKVFLKNVAPVCAALLESKSEIDKDQFVISFIFLKAGFDAYMGMTYLMTDGKLDENKWSKYFDNKDQFEMYKSKSQSLFEAWYSPLLTKFNISMPDMIKIIVNLASENKYP